MEEKSSSMTAEDSMESVNEDVAETEKQVRKSRIKNPLAKEDDRGGD